MTQSKPDQMLDARVLVERYSPSREFLLCAMKKDPEGEWVRLSALTAALDENDRLREALQSIAHDGEGWLNRKRTKIVARAALKGADQ